MGKIVNDARNSLNCLGHDAFLPLSLALPRAWNGMPIKKEVIPIDISNSVNVNPFIFFIVILFCFS